MDTKRIPVIIDTDPGVDDIVAILLALASPEIEILAFVVSFGNTDIDSSYLNILKVYQAIGRHLQLHPIQEANWPNYSLDVKPILARGSARPLHGELHSAEYFHGRDGLGEITQRHPELDVSIQTEHPQLRLTERDGVDVALDLIRANAPRTITYIALGPLTNLAQMMRKDSILVRDKIGRIISMGGALDVPGNTTPSAEFNFFADPYAVKELLVSPPRPQLGLPLDRFLMIPLDITTPHELPFPIYVEFIDPTFSSAAKPSEEDVKDPLIHFTSSFLEKTRQVMLEFGKDAMELHDIVAVWCAISNPPFAEGQLPSLSDGWEMITRVFDIERTGELTRGMLVVDRRSDQSNNEMGHNRSETFQKVIPAQVEVENAPLPNSTPGILCITDTPGPDTLLRYLFRRVWGSHI